MSTFRLEKPSPEPLVANWTPLVDGHICLDRIAVAEAVHADMAAIRTWPGGAGVGGDGGVGRVPVRRRF